MIERRLSRLALALVVGVGGCSPATEESAASASGEAPTATVRADAPARTDAPIRVITSTYLPRVVEEDYVEEVPLGTVGEAFNLLVTPRVRTPREGPWNVTFVGPDGESSWKRGEPVRVDPVTGGITFLVRKAAVTTGEWTIEFDLVPGGLTHGPERQVFRFRAVE